MSRIWQLILLAMASLPFRAVPAIAQTADSLVILSFNVREWTRDTDESKDTYWKRRMEAMEKMIGDVDPDVICLQEVLPQECRSFRQPSNLYPQNLEIFRAQIFDLLGVMLGLRNQDNQCAFKMGGKDRCQDR